MSSVMTTNERLQGAGKGVPFTTPAKVLIVDDLEGVRWALSNALRLDGFAPLLTSNGSEALACFMREKPDVVLLDVGLPDIEGFEVLTRIKALDKSVPVVMVTANGKASDAMRAIQAGAYDYVAKPFDNRDIVLTVRRALDEKTLKSKKRQSFTRTGVVETLPEIMGGSAGILRIQTEIELVAKTNLSVLLQGDSGTGKDVVAHAIHATSLRADKPFVALDCGAIPETLIENELFGHEKGAFTGAHQVQIGAFEMAAGGTLFLDEIGNLPLAVQSTLLRVLETQRIRRIGGTRELHIDFRLIAATNINLQSPERGNAFRNDLYYRLAEFTINLPSLKERNEDIVFLAHRFLAQANLELGKQVAGLSIEAEETLHNYSWPGNVRELRNQIRRATLLCIDPTGIITPELLMAINKDFKPVCCEQFSYDQQGTSCSSLGGDSAYTLNIEKFLFNGEGISLKEITTRMTAQIERLVLLQTLQHTKGNKALAARLLKIDYKTIHNKLKILGIS
ncbi:MAG: sigma-54 dependent transcriptional regulator [Candidatus Nitrotoga sp.]|nr:sigma-54 dependent transcriptional regulator [Candidatus Nitrotoga sp.]